MPAAAASRRFNSLACCCHQYRMAASGSPGRPYPSSSNNSFSTSPTQKSPLKYGIWYTEAIASRAAKVASSLSCRHCLLFCCVAAASGGTEDDKAGKEPDESSLGGAVNAPLLEIPPRRAPPRRLLPVVSTGTLLLPLLAGGGTASVFARLLPLFLPIRPFECLVALNCLCPLK